MKSGKVISQDVAPFDHRARKAEHGQANLVECQQFYESGRIDFSFMLETVTNHRMFMLNGMKRSQSSGLSQSGYNGAVASIAWTSNKYNQLSLNIKNN